MPLDPLRVKAIFQAALEEADPAARAALLDRACGDDLELRRRVGELLDFDQPTEVGPSAGLGETRAVEQTPAGFVLGETVAVPPGETLGASAADEATVAADFVLGEAGAIPSGATAGFTDLGRPEPRAASPPRRPSASLIGETVAGRYKVRQEIGEGGMGTVYMAEQVAPVKRFVALKLIRSGMDSRQVLARFDSERQALAIMDHPNIARILDAGSTDLGQPYFVMELVKGVPLTEYCDAHRLDLPTRLNLFRQICGAVQHAHQKGVIHRDLKPTNILVEDHDGHPVPKVIDFGLAKATSGLQLTEQSLFTAFGSITGTPLYMAPEQATFNAVDVDTRADIYALGVILYELLTGSTPIRRESLNRAAFDEVLRVIREDEPHTPSHRISTSEGLPGLAANRHVEPSKLGRFLRGDLDWVVMKALAKERVRRYDSATALSSDVERFLNHEPVTAGPPTAAYRTRKFIRRHRGQVVAATLLVAALVAGVAGTTLGLFEARRQAEYARKQEGLAKVQEAEAKKQEGLARVQAAEATRQEGLARVESAEKEKARAAEADQRAKAERRSAQLGKINDILGAIFKDINPRNAEKDGKPLGAILGDRLKQAADQIEGESIGDPLAVARTQLMLGQSLAGLGHAPQAIELLSKARATFERELGPDDPETLSSMSNLATAYQAAGEFGRAVPLLERALESFKRKLGEDHPDTMTCMNDLATAYESAGKAGLAVPLLERALESLKRKLGEDHPSTLASMNNLANAYEAAGQAGRAVPLLERTVELARRKLGEDHPDTLRSMSNLAAAYEAAGEPGRAVPLLERAVESLKRKQGEDHPDTLRSMDSLAAAYQAAGEPRRAVPLLERAVELARRKLGEDHPDTMTCMNDLANAYQAAGEFGRAVPLLERSLELTRRKLGEDHPNTSASMNNLATAYEAAGQAGRAVPLLERAVESLKRKLGEDHPRTLASMSNLATAYQEVGQAGRAVPLLERAVESLKRELGEDHPDTLAIMRNLGTVYEATGEPGRAVSLYERMLESRKRKLGEDHPKTLTIMNGLAYAYLSTGQADRAVPLLRAVVDRSRKAEPRPAGYSASLATFGRALVEAGSWAEAEPVLRECLALRQASEPDDWRTFNATSVLGGALLGQGKVDEAAPLLKGGYEGMVARIGKIPPPARMRLVEASDRLIKLAEATGKPDEAESWRKQKATWNASLPSPASSSPKPAEAPAPGPMPAGAGGVRP